MSCSLFLWLIFVHALGRSVMQATNIVDTRQPMPMLGCWILSLQMPIRAHLFPTHSKNRSTPAAGPCCPRTDSCSIRRIFVIGPLHHARLVGNPMACSGFRALKTPLGSLEVDMTFIEELKLTLNLNYIDPDIDQDEHSIEMQFPFLNFIFKE